MHNTVFVYGTLRKHHGNHAYLKESRYVGIGKTVDRYAFYLSGLPYVAKDPPISRIVGEIYCVDDRTLQRLDRLEGHPDFYRRELIEVELGDGGGVISAWIYFALTPSGHIVESGDYNRI